MPKGVYDRSAVRVRHEAGVAADGVGVETNALAVIERSARPEHVRLVSPIGWIDEIGAVYGPKMAGYETANPAEINALIMHGARYEVVT